MEGLGLGRCSPRSPLRGSPREAGCPDSPRESHSLTHVAARVPARARRPRPPPAPRPQPRGPPQPSPATGDPPPPLPPPAGSLGAQRAQSGDLWAGRAGGAGRWSRASGLPDEPSVAAWGVRPPCACPCACGRAACEPRGSQGSRPGPAAGPRADPPSAQSLQDPLQEAAARPGDQRAAGVLARLQRARRMRELQRQAAPEELQLSGHRVQATLGRQRGRLLQESPESPESPAQWPQQEPRGRGPDGQPRGSARSGHPGGAPASEAQPAPRTQGPEPPLQEPPGAVQGPREQDGPQVGEQACPGKLPAPETQARAWETSLSSLVNHQARRVLLDCQAKAEELLRKLSLEQSCPQPLDSQHEPRTGPQRPQRPQEQLRQVQPHAGATEVQTRVHQQLLAQLAELERWPPRSPEHRSARDKGQHNPELSVPREEFHHILRLTAKKEEKGHVEGIMEGIKEAVRRKEQRLEQISRESDAAFQEFQKLSWASRRDQARALATSLLEQRPLKGPHGAGPQRC
ncbi:coiled-coil domain-containing protein 185 [Canis lupus dingo]|uniref:coiled-coil domain-containing protein 185 n=1 Tax=Canis lupus dingo TaxID=286419 RepID=UPI000DC66ACC|nr:coiled-coil domain-containing protein 185 [Canis lupus dingo]